MDGQKWYQTLVAEAIKDPFDAKTYKQNCCSYRKAMDATLVPLTPIHKRVFGFAVRRI